MIDVRWENEMEEAMELIYRIQTDHGGRLPESEARDQLGDWVDDAARRAERLSWLVVKGSPVTLMVTVGGRRALDAALASKNAIPPPHWLSGSIPAVRSLSGPVILPHSVEPYDELKQQVLEEGILTQEDIDRIARSPWREERPGEPEEYRTLYEAAFPGRRWFAVDQRYSEDHPLGGGVLEPAGYEGAYQVTATLTRRGAPNIPYVYVTDPNMMEGDSHLRLPVIRGEGGAEGVLTIVHTSHEDGETVFELVPNRQGRLGKIRTVLRAESAGDAHQKAYRLLNPVVCDLSYRYDMPIEVLQMNIAELATLTLSGVKDDDFREKTFDPEFLGAGLNYGELTHYEFFTRLYREGVNSSSVDYGFLCFYRIAEGIIKLRRKWIIEQEDKSPEDVTGPTVVSGVLEDDEASEAFQRICWASPSGLRSRTSKRIVSR